MKKKFNLKKLSAIGAGVIMALSLTFGLIYGNLNLSETDSEVSPNLTASAATTKVGNVLYDSTDTSKLGTFEDGTTYWYTDYNLGVKLSNGDKSTTTDRVAVTVVKTGNAAGSRLNPYVINSSADWANFVTYVATSGVNNGSGKYFVLNQDLDYKNATLPTVVMFAGTFFGSGHSINNAVLQDRYATNEVQTGLFCATTGNVYIADLFLMNYKLTSAAVNMGAIVGFPYGTSCTVVNCTAQGVMTQNDQHQPTVAKGYEADKHHINVVSMGGIIGTHMIPTCTIKLYKAVADFTGTQRQSCSGDWGGIGGILGWVDCKGYNPIGNIYMYDSYASMNITTSAATGVSGEFAGMIAFSRCVPVVYVRNCVCISNLNIQDNYSAKLVDETATGSLFYPSALTVMGHGGTKCTTETLDCKNFYGYSICTKGNAKYAVPFVNQYSTGNFSATTLSNNTVYSYAGASAKSICAATTSANFAAWQTAAKKALTNDEIWIPSVIDEIKEPAAGSNIIQKPNIAETPIQVNKTRITFRDATNTALTFRDGGAATREYELDQVGAVLPTPVEPAGKTFVGWSLDNTKDTTLYTNFPEKLYGNATMYAVWNMTNVTVQLSATTREGSATTKDYNINANYIGEPVVTLTAAITAAPCDLEKANISWSWYKKEKDADEVKLDGETSDTLELTELTNATYYAKVKIVDENVLWRTDPTSDTKSANEYNIVIEKGVLSPSGGITLAEKVGEGEQAKDVFAYWGQPLHELTNYVVAPMQNTAGIAIAGTVSWKEAAKTVGDTQQTYDAYFHPTDTEHYEDDTLISVTILPTILQWKFEFAVAPQVDNVVFTFNEEYGKTYTRAQVAQRFEDNYFDWLNDIGEADSRYSAMVGRMPYFGTEDIMQYRATSAVGAYFDTEHVADNGYIVKDKAANSAVLNTPVAFNTLDKSSKFTVTLFREEQANGTLADTTQTLGYGESIAKPLKSLHMDGTTTQYLEGWFVCNATGEVLNSEGNKFTGAEGEERVSWDFATARITGHTYLGAVWKDGYLKLTSIYAYVNGSSTKTFTARTLAKPTDFVAVGIYTVYENETEMNRDNPRKDANGNPQQVELILSSEDYRVSAENTTTGTTEYHVGATRADGKSNYAVTISSKSNHELFCTVPVTVVAKRLDMNGINFPNQTVTYDENTTQRVGDASQEVAVALAPQGVQDGDYSIAYEYCNSSNASINWGEGVKDIGLYYVYLQLNFNTEDFVAGRVSATLTIIPQPITVYVAWNADNQKEYTYNGQIQHPEASFYTETSEGARTPVTISFVYTGNSEQKIANADGVYSKIGVELRNARYVLAEDAMATIEFRINRAKVQLPQLANNSFEFMNDYYDISEYIGYDSNTLEFLVEVRNGTAKDVPSNGTITSQVRLRDAINSEWEDGSSGEKQVVWTITAKVMTVPTFTETLIYSGTKYVVAEHLNFYDPVITVFGSETEATNAGMYRVNLRLPTENGGKNYVWANKEFNGTVEWQIQKAELYLNWDGWSYLYNGNTYSPRAKIAFGLVDADAALQNQDPRFLYTGDPDKRESGSYKIEVEIGQTSELYKNYVIAKDSATFYWVIKESSKEVVITVVWDIPADGGYLFNDEIQFPKVKALYSENGMGEEDLDKYNITYTGDWNKSKYRGTYTVGVEITAEDNTPLRIRQGEATYVIRRNNGLGDPPVVDGGDQNLGGGGAQGGGSTTDTIKYPVVQLIIGGVGAILLVVFTIKTMSYASSTKEAKKKTKELAQISYSFAAPLALLAVGDFLGLGDGAWWGISIGILGLALIMGAAMFVFRGKNKKALAALAEEQARVEDEKEAAKEAAQAARDAQLRSEQQRRDDEFKMMFAAMQQNYQQPAVGYDEMQNMISSAVAGLLPTMQQQMQALPPAQSETDDLRALMQQQQEMLNQLMQERQGQSAYQPEYTQPHGDEDYEELKRIIARQEEMLKGVATANTSDDEMYTLEELYGKLDDDRKRYYYELGGYIMSKPETVQNDGKYAVLFKYRGKTLFKLCIRGDAPVLIYGLDSEMPSEVRISSASALEDAKDVVDLRMKRVDREMK